MKLRICACLCLLSLLPVLAFSQIVLNPSPARAVGHQQLLLSNCQIAGTTLLGCSPNLLEGKELSRPQSVAVDTSSGPPIVYVSDTYNNRVLAWRYDRNTLANGALADAVIGQRDRMSALVSGPGNNASTGLNFPTGVAVDSSGNLYVVDTGNNRILRYRKPLEQRDILPELIIGQSSFSARLANQGGPPTEKTISVNPSNSWDCDGRCLQTTLLFDPQGNLWFTDAGNNRVLRYPASALGAGASNAPAADLVLGQPDFTTGTALQPTVQNRTVRDRMIQPASLALDRDGNLFVSDSINRVLVFGAPLASGKAASRLLGMLPVLAQGQPPLTPVNEYSFNGSLLATTAGVFTINNTPFVLDTLGCRILRFDPVGQWPTETAALPSPPAKAVIGQDAMTGNRLLENRGKPEPSASSYFLPVNAVFAGGEVFVADSGNHRVLILPDVSTGPPLAAIGSAVYDARRVLGQLSFEFNSANLIEGKEMSTPGDVVVDKRSDPPRLYVADTGNNRVLGFRDARKVRPGTHADLVIGQPDSFRAVRNYPSGDVNAPTDSSLYVPAGLAVDSDGNLWVADSGNGRVLRFPRPFDQVPPRADMVIGQPGFTVKIQDPTASTMGVPTGLAFTGDGHLLVSDAAHNRVLFFRKPLQTGMAATNVLGQPGAGDRPDFNAAAAGNARNRLNGPRHIALDSDDRLYVADTRNNRVLIWDRVTVARPGADAAYSLENSTSASGRLNAPVGVAVNQTTGEIWVTDTNTSRLLRFAKFQDLDPINPNVADPANILTAPGPQATTFDGFGNLFVAHGGHRVDIFFQATRAVNGANFGRARQGDGSGQRMVPGMIASIFALGTPFTDQTVIAGVPLPTTLADLRVLVNEVPAPLYFVSPGQINFLVPTYAPESGSVDVQVVKASAEQILTVGCTVVQTAGVNTTDTGDDKWACTGPLQGDVASPAVFTFGGGSGQVAALNQDNTVNGPSNAIARNQVLQIFGTGQGRVDNPPPDGSPATGVTPTTEMPRVLIGTAFVPAQNVLYSGLAPGLIGVWQINVRVPDTVAPGTAVPLVVEYKSKLSNLQNPCSTQNPNGICTTIAVKQ